MRGKAPLEIEILGEKYISAKKAQELIKLHVETIKSETRKNNITHIVWKSAFYYKIEWLKEYINEKTKIGTYKQKKN